MKKLIARDLRDNLDVTLALLKTHIPVIEKASRVIYDCLKSGHKILFFGNGGSSGDSQHLAAELVGRYEKERRALAAIALTTDTSVLTAVANDYGFERIFERQIAALGSRGDIAFGISTSGRSKNVLLGIAKAKALGLFTIGLSGRSGGELNSRVDLLITIPSDKTARIQESHILIGHILCERVDELWASQ
ncbi:MAG: phosphoheptose isomerase [Candidatus Omnitrophica bacterium CG07_land_8_20_14_0_80_50_8]|nr:MAG: phosphoheptose isomerase [Candidatus Omnitrophica bacterium CG1_02_49_16]PIU40375.1 MAG: phosphoheptose isomerase [Candidatus Omnitrophica bacterium CG07_land_8_20_14_0_80_50_8]